MAEGTIHRIAARAIIIDSADRVLLIWGCDPAKPNGHHWWYTPGGGVEAGESYAEAIMRELREEIRLDVHVTGEPMLEHATTFEYNGQTIVQRNVFFPVYVERFEPDTSGLSPHDAEGIVDVRWVTVDELRATPDPVFPPKLPDIVAELIARRAT